MVNNYNITQSKPAAYTIKVTNQSGLLTPATIGTPVVSAAGILTYAETIAQLSDVIEINPPNNATLVYDAYTEKYIVQLLNLDGGTF
jgi:hypothetical protein